MSSVLGQKLEPILNAIRDVLLEHDIETPGPVNYSTSSFNSIIYIFQSAILDKAWVRFEKENWTLEQRCAFAEDAGNRLRIFINALTGIDTIESFREEFPPSDGMPDDVGMSDN